MYPHIVHWGITHNRKNPITTINFNYTCAGSPMKEVNSLEARLDPSQVSTSRHSLPGNSSGSQMEWMKYLADLPWLHSTPSVPQPGCSFPPFSRTSKLVFTNY